MADVKWIKIVVDVFDDEKIRIIETMPEGDALIVIWFKILCVAGRSNHGGLLMLTDEIPYTDDMLASVFNRDPRIIKLALGTFQRMGMIEIIDNVMFLPNWEKHQNAQSLEAIREKTRLRTARYRENLRLCDGKSVTVASQERHGDGDVTQQNKNKNKNQEIEEESPPPRGPGGAGDPLSDDDEQTMAIRHCQDAGVMMNGRAMEAVGDYLSDGLSGEMIVFAADIATDNGTRAWSYVRTILDRWRDNGICTLAAAKAEQAVFRAKKQGIQEPKERRLAFDE